jgi:hypothetical protein
MSRKPKLDPIEVELPPEEFLRSLQGVLGGTAYLDRFRDSFQEEDNPLFAWAAICIARKTGRPIPEWVLQYLEEAAKRLFNKPPGKKVPEHVSAALRIRTYGKGSSISRYFDLLERLQAVEAVIKRVEGPSPRRTLEQACGDVSAELGKQGKKVSNVTIEKWTRQYRKHFIKKNIRPKPPIKRITS